MPNQNWPRLASGFALRAGTTSGTPAAPDINGTFSLVGRIVDLDPGIDNDPQDTTVQASTGWREFANGLIDLGLNFVVRWDQAESGGGSVHSYDEIYEDWLSGQAREYAVDWAPGTTGYPRWRFTAIVGNISAPMPLGSIINATVQLKNWQNATYNGIVREAIP